MPHQTLITNNQPKRKKLIIISVIALLFFSFCFYERYFFIEIYKAFFPVKWNKGDKIYASADFLNRPILDLPIQRLIRPMTLAEIDNLNIEASKKIELKRKFNPSAGLKAIQTKDAIFMKLLWKYKTAVIGDYINRVVLEDGTYMYAIKPNIKLVETQYNPDKMPDNYIIADTNIYIFTFGTAASDPSLF